MFLGGFDFTAAGSLFCLAVGKHIRMLKLRLWGVRFQSVLLLLWPASWGWFFLPMELSVLLNILP